jgi:alcohol dehydrogenase class IV
MINVEKMFSGIYNFHCARKIVFGNGSANQYGAEVKRLNAKYPLIVTDKGVVNAGLIDRLKASLEREKIRYEIFAEVIPDAPIRLVEEGVAITRKNKHDLIIGFGGGSSIDTAKVISIMALSDKDIMHCFGIETVEKAGLPKIFTPTTAGTGSEIGSGFVCLDEKTGEKRTGHSPFAFADVAIVDPVLTMTMPPRVTAETGVDALSHALECYVSAKSNPFSEMFAYKGIETICRYIRKAYARGQDDLESRYFMCLGVHLGTMGVRSSGLGACHALCHPLTAKYHVSHGLSIGVLLPHVMEYNLIGNLEKYANIAKAMGERIDEISVRDAAYRSVEAMKKLIGDLSLPLTLKECKVEKEDLQTFSETVNRLYKNNININPREMRVEDIRQIYENAW